MKARGVPNQNKKDVISQYKWRRNVSFVEFSTSFGRVI